VSIDKDGYDLSVIDPYVQLNKTTLKEVRTLLGTPTFTAVAESDNSKVVGYSFAGHNTGAVLAREFGRGMLSFGLAADKREYTVKVALFKFNSDDAVIDYQKGGASYLSRSRFTHWNECEHKLTPEEINSPAVYSDKQICEIYAKEVAAKEGIAVDKVDTGKEFPWCNVPCQAVRVAQEKYGNLKDLTSSVRTEEDDGSKYIFK
jgi:formylmethanofuran dehydrogenase subunit E-like metal-binding protein